MKATSTIKEGSALIGLDWIGLGFNRCLASQSRLLGCRYSRRNRTTVNGWTATLLASVCALAVGIYLCVFSRWMTSKHVRPWVKAPSMIREHGTWFPKARDSQPPLYLSTFAGN